MPDTSMISLELILRVTQSAPDWGTIEHLTVGTIDGLTNDWLVDLHDGRPPVVYNLHT